MNVGLNMGLNMGMDINLIPSYSYDDVLLRPRHSLVSSRKDIKLNTILGNNEKNQIHLKIPFVSSPMDTVTEDKMAIGMALQGGLGIIHRFQTIEEQSQQVRNVKRYLQYIFTDPVTISSKSSLKDVIEKRKKYGIKTLFVTDTSGTESIVGICTNRDTVFDDYDFNYMNTESNSNKVHRRPEDIEISNVMTRFEDMNKCFVTRERFNWLLENQNSRDFYDFMVNIRTMMKKNRIQKIPIYLEKQDRNENKETMKTKTLLGMTTQNSVNHFFNNRESACLDKYGRLCVGAAIGMRDDAMERAVQCFNEGADLICIDVANGHNEHTLKIVSKIRERFPKIVIMGGNVCTGEGAYYLGEAGCDCIRVGIGSGSICSTRLETGVGFGQWSALNECYQYTEQLKKDKNICVQLISDGGSLGKTGNKVKALASGATAIMLGRSLAGCNESPGSYIRRNGKLMKYFRGMASTMASLSHKEKKGEYEVDTIKSAEGVDGVVEPKGKLYDFIKYMCDGIKSGLSYQGVFNIEELHNLVKNQKVEWGLVTYNGEKESGIRIKTFK